MPRRNLHKENLLKDSKTESAPNENVASLLRSIRRLQNSMKFETNIQKRSQQFELMVHSTKFLQRLLEPHFKDMTFED